MPEANPNPLPTSTPAAAFPVLAFPTGSGARSQAPSSTRASTPPRRCLDLSGIVVRRATSHADVERALDVRWQGYKKYFPLRAEVVDAYDHAPNNVLLLATDREDQPLGTLRILDRRFGPIELDSFVPVSALVREALLPCAEATRFSVPAHPNSASIKFALWKTVFLYCRSHGLNSVLAWVRPGAARDYRALQFAHTGSSGVFSHPLLGSLEHQTYALDIGNAERLYRETSHPFYYAAFQESHPQLSFN